MATLPTPAEELAASIAGTDVSCIHCGLCLPACPTYRETGNEAESPRGRIYLMRALVEGRLQADEGTTHDLDTCVGCRACETACPAGVPYGFLLERARAAYVEPLRPASARTWLWRPFLRKVLPSRKLMALATVPGRLTRKLLVRNGKAPGWLPTTIGRSLESLPAGGSGAAIPEWTPAIGPERGVAALLAGCAMPTLFPGANPATVRMLARAGYRVWVPPAQGCCGAVQLHDGDMTGARARARANLAAFAREGVTAIVGNAGGCTATLHEYGQLLAADPEWAPRAAEFAARVVDLASILATANLAPPERAQPAVTVTYHDPCHLAHGLGVRKEPRQLLAALPGVTLVELPEADWCCGGAGSYTLLQPEMSDKLLANKLHHVASTRAAVVVTANPPCLMQIGRGLATQADPPRLVHLAEFLDEAYSK